MTWPDRVGLVRPTSPRPGRRRRRRRPRARARSLSRLRMSSSFLAAATSRSADAEPPPPVDTSVFIASSTEDIDKPDLDERKCARSTNNLSGARTLARC